MIGNQVRSIVQNRRRLLNFELLLHLEESVISSLSNKKHSMMCLFASLCSCGIYFFRFCWIIEFSLRRMRRSFE